MPQAPAVGFCFFVFYATGTCGGFLFFCFLCHRHLRWVFVFCFLWVSAVGTYGVFCGRPPRGLVRGGSRGSLLLEGGLLFIVRIDVRVLLYVGQGGPALAELLEDVLRRHIRVLLLQLGAFV